MRKDYVSLDIICKRENKPDEKLVFKDGKYFTKEYTKRTFLANEGPLSMIENISVNLLNWDDIDGLTLPSDIIGFSLVLSNKSLFTSTIASVIQTNESKEMVRVSCGEFNSSLSETLKKYAYKLKEIYNQKEKTFSLK